MPDQLPASGQPRPYVVYGKPRPEVASAAATLFSITLLWSRIEPKAGSARTKCDRPERRHTLNRSARRVAARIRTRSARPGGTIKTLGIGLVGARYGARMHLESYAQLPEGLVAVR